MVYDWVLKCFYPGFITSLNKYSNSGKWMPLDGRQIDVPYHPSSSSTCYAHCPHYCFLSMNNRI